MATFYYELHFVLCHKTPEKNFQWRCQKLENKDKRNCQIYEHLKKRRKGAGPFPDQPINIKFLLFNILSDKTQGKQKDKIVISHLVRVYPVFGPTN